MNKVNQRKAPGAIRAIALLVRPVRPSVACICGAVGSCGMNSLLASRFGIRVTNITDVLFELLLPGPTREVRTLSSFRSRRRVSVELALRTEEGYEPCGAKASIRLFFDIA